MSSRSVRAKFLSDSPLPLELRVLPAGSSIYLADLNGTNGIRFNGIDQTEPTPPPTTQFGDQAGWSISIVGDINDDGYDDMLIGTLGGDGSGNSTYGVGEAYLVFGKADWSSSPTLELDSLNGTNGVILYGVDNTDYAGEAVSRAGDVNNDGFDDFLVGAHYGNGSAGTVGDAGETYLIFGKADWTSTPTLNLSSLNGTTGVTFYGIDQSDYSGTSLGAAGDVNNDGFDDFLIGAPGSKGAGNVGSTIGEAYLIFGKANWSSTPTVELSSLSGTTGVTFYGINNEDHAGEAVSSAGDINNDGFDDILIGAPQGWGASNGKPRSGETYLIFGKANWSSTPTVALSSLDGTTGVTLFGADSYDVSGGAVSGAGDVNGDGFDDILIGADDAYGIGNTDTLAGEAYLVFGKASWTSTPTFSLGSLNGKNGVTLYGKGGGGTGYSVSAAGDFNGDGYADVIIGSPTSNGRTSSISNVSQAGQSYLVYGKPDWSYIPSVNLTTLNGVNGLAIYGREVTENSGFDVRSGGDVNGDGYDDLLIGAPGANKTTIGSDHPSAGAAYVVFGGPSPTVDEIGVHRSGTFYQDANNSFTPNAGDRVFTFGNPTDIPLVGDWNNDGVDEIGVFRGGSWYLDVNGNNVWDGTAGGDALFTFGNPTDTPLIGDWNGDGTDDVGVKRGNSYYLDLNGNRVWNGTGGGDALYSFGNPTDTPVVGDWNGNDHDKIGVFRDGVFYLDQNGNGVWNDTSGGDARFGYGMTGDVPVIGDWNGDGISDVGIVRGNSWYLDQNGNRAWNGTLGSDALFVYGNPTDTPIVGNWTGGVFSNSQRPAATPSQLDQLFSQLAPPTKKPS